MHEWRRVKLHEVADEVTVGHVGPMVDEYRSSGIPFLRSQNVLPHRIDLSDIKFIDGDFHSRLKKSALRPSDVVTVRTGKPGTTAVVPESLVEANCSDLVITRPGPALDAQWLSYYINEAASDYVSAHLVGAVQQHFNVGAAKNMVLHLPPLKEQQAIAEVLGALDDKIATNARLGTTADEWVRARFVQLTACTEERIVLADLAFQPKNLVDPGLVMPNTVYVGLEHIPRRMMWLDSMGSAVDVSSTKAAFEAGDVLFGKLRPYFHKVVVAPSKGICSTDVLVVRPTDAKLAGYVLASVSSDPVVEQCTANSGGTRMPRTSWKDLAAVEVPWPGSEVAVEFSERVIELGKSVEARIRESEALAAMRDALLPQLMSGKIQVKDAEQMVGDVV